MASEGHAQRIESVLRERIDSGELRPGDELASESQLAAEFAVSRGTVRAAVLALERAGLVVSVPAKGRYVRGASGQVEAMAPAARAHEIAAQLRQEIAAGQYAPGEAFLSEKDVCERFGLSRYASRLALSELESAGLIVAVHGKGRAVTEARSDEVRSSAGTGAPERRA